jgi:general secretion pathway protein K
MSAPSLPANRTQCGAALLMALMITAVCATLASAVLWRVDQWLTQVETMHDARQAQRLALGGVDWGRSILWERDRDKIDVDYLGEPWSTRVPPIPVAGGEIGGQMFDEQARFNLASLKRNAAPDDFSWQCYARLLATLGLPPALAAALQERMASSATPRFVLSGVGSLAAVPGYSPTVITRLRGFVTLLPEATAVNVNTASAEVLTAIVPGLTIDAARDLIAKRTTQPFVSKSGFASRLPESVRSGLKYDSISLYSQYFRVDTFSRFGRGRAAVSALLNRPPGQWPVIVWTRTP